MGPSFSVCLSVAQLPMIILSKLWPWITILPSIPLLCFDSPFIALNFSVFKRVQFFNLVLWWEAQPTRYWKFSMCKNKKGEEGKKGKNQEIKPFVSFHLIILLFDANSYSYYRVVKSIQFSFNITLPCAPRSSFHIFIQISVWTSHLSLRARPFHFPRFDQPNNIQWTVKFLCPSLHNFLLSPATFPVFEPDIFLTTSSLSTRFWAYKFFTLLKLSFM